MLSIFLGHPGERRFLGFSVSFVQERNKYYSFSHSNFAFYFVGQAASVLLNNYTFKVLTFGYLHTMVHEMGHALTAKLFNVHSSIKININNCIGCTQYNNYKKLPLLKDSLVALAGPLADVIFSVSIIFAAFFASPFITVPVSTFFALGAAIWITGELYYALDSLNSGDGDFANIGRNGNLHLLFATVALITPVALTALALL